MSVAGRVYRMHEAGLVKDSSRSTWVRSFAGQGRPASSLWIVWDSDGRVSGTLWSSRMPLFVGLGGVVDHCWHAKFSAPDVSTSTPWTRQLSRGKAKIDDVSVLHLVFLAFEAHLAVLATRG